VSRARKVKKAGRYFEYELEYWEVHIIYGGPEERHARRSRMRDKQWHGGGWGALWPAHGVKYHAPRAERKPSRRAYYVTR